MIACAWRCGGVARVALLALVLGASGVTTARVAATPLAETGDAGLRHDIQLLADAGLIRSPIMAWPASWPDIARQIGGRSPSRPLTRAERGAWHRLRKRLRREQQTGVWRGSGSTWIGDGFADLRSYEQVPRTDQGVRVGLDRLGDRYALKLQLTHASDPPDDREFRLDGSYLGVVLGNWGLFGGQIDRWWGPGWEGSLILGNNSRPVPALSLQRLNALPFQSRLLSWIGPWRLDLLLGQLESDRAVPDALLFGMRIGLRPFELFELGLSRSAQWGGEGRPQDFDTFVDLLVGRDNRGDDGIDITNEPGNQMAGFDLRVPIHRWRVAGYAQWIGEDEANGFPSRYLGLVGLEHWGSVGSDGRSYRFAFEAVDTTAGVGGERERNLAYQHPVYRSGYTYYGFGLGHSLGGDTLMYSLRGMFIEQNGGQFTVVLRHGIFNRDGTGLQPFSGRERADFNGVDLRISQQADFGRLELGAGWRRLDPDNGASDTDTHAYLRLTHALDP